MRHRAIGFLFFASCLLAECTRIGALSIQDERNSYNDVIHDTGTEQLLLNIVRAHYFETPSFFDVIEVDQTKTLQGNLQGGSSNIGNVAILGALSSTLTATDSPIIKYQPPSSSGFVQQVVQPIGLANISRLINSNVNIAPLLRLSIDRLSPAYIDYFWALDTIDALDELGAIRVDAIDETTIRIALFPYGVLTSSLSAPVHYKPLDCLDLNGSRQALQRLWANLVGIMGAPAQNYISLKLASNIKQRARIIATRSALGALRMAEVGDAQDVSFVSRPEADAIREENRNSQCFSEEYYYIGDDKGSIEAKWRRQYELLTQSSWPSLNASKDLRALGHSRALIIVEQSAVRPPDAYVSVLRKGVWYSIADGDTISKKNFSLLGNLLIIQAQPSASPPTPTVISAGGTK